MIRSEPSKASLFLEDVEIGQEWCSGDHTVTSEDIGAFCRLTRDDHLLHTDAEYCRLRGFPTVIAHGLFGLSLMEGLKTSLRLYETTSIASLGWDKVRFRTPIFAGDTVHLRMRFADKRQSRNPDRGVVSEFMELLSGSNEVVIDAVHASLILSRNASRSH